MGITHSYSLKDYQTKNLVVFKLIREKILSGELKSGEKIVIRKISSDLEVSETPIREALIMLEAEGLVSSIPHTGYIVTKLNLRELKDILTIRFNLEFLATKIAFDNISSINFERLGDTIKEMKDCIRNNDIVKYGRLNREFHQIIYEASNNKFLFKLILELWDKSGRMRSVFLLEPDIIESSYNEHIQLLEFFRKKDKTNAMKIIKRHKKRSLSTLLKHFDIKKHVI